MRLPTITLKLKHRFQFDNSVYKIQSIVGDEVSAVCVYGESNGSIRLFKSEDVVRSIIHTSFQTPNNLNPLIVA